MAGERNKPQAAPDSGAALPLAPWAAWPTSKPTKLMSIWQCTIVMMSGTVYSADVLTARGFRAALDYMLSRIVARYGATGRCMAVESGEGIETRQGIKATDEDLRWR